MPSLIWTTGSCAGRVTSGPPHYIMRKCVQVRLPCLTGWKQEAGNVLTRAGVQGRLCGTGTVGSMCMRGWCAMKTMLALLVCVVVCLAGGCLSLSRGERDDYYMLRQYDLPLSDHYVKKPALAGALNLLPGAGNVYLAIGTDETVMWPLAGVGVVSWLVWPLSALVAIPEAAIDAVTINKRAAIYYFMRTDEGKAKVQAAKERRKELEAIRLGGAR